MTGSQVGRRFPFEEREPRNLVSGTGHPEGQGSVALFGVSDDSAHVWGADDQRGRRRQRHLALAEHRPERDSQSRSGAMAQLFELSHDPKVLELEEADDGLVRLVLTLNKLGQLTKLDFFLDGDEASALATALAR